MNVRVLEKSWRSPGNLFLKKDTNPAQCRLVPRPLCFTAVSSCGTLTGCRLFRNTKVTFTTSLQKNRQATLIEDVAASQRGRNVA